MKFSLASPLLAVALYLSPTSVNARIGNSPRLLTCQVDSHWCSHPGAVYKNVDCDGDGHLDHVCVDFQGNKGVISAANGCVDSWPGEGPRGCPNSPNALSYESPVSENCKFGGTCQCGMTGDGQQITMQSYGFDSNDQKVWGCGETFKINGGELNTQWGLSGDGTTGEASGSIGGIVSWSLSDSFDGWEGCCNICGTNLQLAGVLSGGWQCKNAAPAGIWLVGKDLN